MENFYLILIKSNGEIIHNPFATSHKDLIEKYLTYSDTPSKTYFKARFSPKDDGRLDDVDNYQIIIDEAFIPVWFKGIFVEEVQDKLKTIISSMIIKGRKPLLLHDGVILTGDAVVEVAKHSIIFAMYDNARIKVLDFSSEVHEMCGDTIIEEMIDGAKVINMWGFAKIFEMRDYAKVLKMFGQAKVGKMLGNSRIAVLKGDANILEMRDTAQADRVRHMSRVDEMHGHSVIEEMWDWSVVEKMFDNSRINFMDEESRVLEMHGESMVEHMAGNAVVEKLYENSLVRKLEDMAQILERDLGEQSK
jgi:hypothetical protein